MSILTPFQDGTLKEYDRVEIVASLRDAINRVNSAYDDTGGPRPDFARADDLRQAIGNAQKAITWITEVRSNLQSRVSGKAS